MIAFLELLESKYGGAEGYIKHYVGLSEHDINIIRNNILVPGDSRLQTMSTTIRRDVLQRMADSHSSND